MTPFYADEWLTIYEGDCRIVLTELPADSVDCVVTSPPYWGLRDYGNEGQLGLERTPEEYVANMVAVFAEVRRVLKPSGTCWLNLGDSYSGAKGDTYGGFNERYRGKASVVDKQADAGRARVSAVQRAPVQRVRGGSQDHGDGLRHSVDPTPSIPKPAVGLKPKDLVGIPWRVAFALQADGWYLRSDVIWSKPNPMPESVTDRPTKSHEYLFLLTKSARYYFDADAVREGVSPNTHGGRWTEGGDKQTALGQQIGGRLGNSLESGNRNIRSVWNIATRPYPGAHFAVFPPELPERCIKAGSSERGVCPECSAPWERVVATTPVGPRPGGVNRHHRDDVSRGTLSEIANHATTTTGWRPTCKHQGDTDGEVLDLASVAAAEAAGVLGIHPNGDTRDGPPAVESHESDRATRDPATRAVAPAVILDPFAGSGTVGLVANRLSRRAILIDLNPEYLRQQMTRNAQTPLGLGAA